MKHIFALLVLLPFLGKAQDCTLKKDRDAYTKEMRYSTGFLSIGGGNKISIEATPKDIDLLFVIGGGVCFNDATVAVVNFDSTKARMNLKNTGTMNCEGFFHFTVRNTQETNYNLQRLIDQKMAIVTFTTDQEKMVVKLTQEQMVMVRKALICLVTQAKALIPTD